MKSVRVKRFQSLWDAELELGDLTVIVGPSSSGKSAFCRALRTATRNSPGSGFVSHGAKTSTVTLTIDDGLAVTAERGAGTSTYRITKGDSEDVYAKSGTSVPEDVRKLLACPLPDEGPDPHFTTQFDGPFLLNVPGSTAARTIGELTNVTLLAEAAREANRRRTESQRLARTRRADSASAAERVRAEFGNLKERRAAAAEARLALAEVTESLALADRLEELAGRADAAHLAAERAEERAAKLEELDGQLADDLDALSSTLGAASRLEELAARHAAASRELAEHSATAERLGRGIEAAEQKTEELLKEMGTCPLCLKPTT